MTSDAGAVAEASTSRLRDRQGAFAFEPHHCFACGELNAHGLQLQLHGDERGCWTELVLDPRFEGWQGIAHGGILATILDEVGAWSVIARGGWGVTARIACWPETSDSWSAERVVGWPPYCVITDRGVGFTTLTTRFLPRRLA